MITFISRQRSDLKVGRKNALNTNKKMDEFRFLFSSANFASQTLFPHDIQDYLFELSGFRLQF